MEGPGFLGKMAMVTLYGVPEGLRGRTRADSIFRPATQFPLTLPRLAGSRPRGVDPGLLLGSGLLRLGRCVPSLCTDQDIQFGFRNFLQNASAELGVVLPPVQAVVLNSHVAGERWELENRDWAMIAVIAVFAILVIVGTVPDLVLNVCNINIFPEMFLKIFQEIIFTVCNIYEGASAFNFALTPIQFRFCNIVWIDCL